MENLTTLQKNKIQIKNKWLLFKIQIILLIMNWKLAQISLKNCIIRETVMCQSNMRVRKFFNICKSNNKSIIFKKFTQVFISTILLLIILTLNIKFKIIFIKMNFFKKILEYKSPKKKKKIYIWKRKFLKIHTKNCKE